MYLRFLLYLYVKLVFLHAYKNVLGWRPSNFAGVNLAANRIKQDNLNILLNIFAMSSEIFCSYIHALKVNLHFPYISGLYYAILYLLPMTISITIACSYRLKAWCYRQRWRDRKKRTLAIRYVECSWRHRIVNHT